MKKILLTLLALGVLAACMGPLPQVPTLGDVELAATKGDEIWMAENYKGKPVLIVFMGSWCPWCKKTIPALNQIGEKYAGQVEIVGAFMDQTPGPVNDVAAEYGLNVKTLFNASEVAEGLGVEGLPHAILFDNKHRAIKMWEGFTPTFAEEFDEQVKRAL